MTIVLLLVSVLSDSLPPARGWRSVYHDGPIAVAIGADRRTYRVGDTFRLRISATNTSDREVLLKAGWREQLSYYHLHPQTGEQVEWPGRVCNAVWLDSAEVVRLGPGRSHVETRGARVFTPDDVCTFDFRLKLWGIRDFARRFDTWQGIAWSNPLRVTVVDRP